MQELSVESEIEIRFNEVDTYNTVWHGNYAVYFETGRQKFANTYALGYRELLTAGFYVPIIKLEIDYKATLKYNDRIRLITTYIDTDATKIIFRYEARRLHDNKLVCTGRSEQVFVRMDWSIQITLPEYFQTWKRRWLTKSMTPEVRS